MSRAFVREDVETPEALPELPLSPHPNYVTARGLEQLRQRERALQARLLAARGAAESAVGSERPALERELRWLQQRLASAIPVAPGEQDPQRVSFGAEVRLVDGDGAEHRYRIVGEDEADPARGSISWTSPLARALRGARVGDSVLWERPAGDVEVDVLDLRYPS